MMKTTIVVGVALASVLVACSDAAQTHWGSDRSATTSSALGGVQDCTAQAQACALDASSPSDIAACEQGLKACLTGLLAEAGVPSLPGFDGGLPPVPGLDAGFPSLPDAGLPALPDAGLPPIPVPDAGAVDACLQALQQCLGSSTSPSQCATQAVTCIEQAI